jgi:UDP-3-O-[3-hydroxymyristoyl] glucosamine N-acyltransferase
VKVFSISDLREVIGDQILAVDGDTHVGFSRAQSISSNEQNGMTFCRENHPRATELLAKTGASVIICGPEQYVPPPGKCLLHVSRPRLAFTRVLKALFVSPENLHISGTATIHSAAQIADGVMIADGCRIGAAKIDHGTVIMQNVVIHDGVNIGRNVRIKAGAVLGGEGFGFARNSEEQWEKFPHIGGLVIEDSVEIGCNACIDRGALDETRIGFGSKIDSLVHIAHNVRVGRNCIVTSGVTIAGSCQLGNSIWIGPRAVLLDGLVIGDDAFIGIGTIVTHSVPAGARIIPVPSKVFRLDTLQR